jgi:hypothetical protein
MDDLSPSRPSMPSSIEKYAPGEPSSGDGNRQKKSSTQQSLSGSAMEPPEVEADSEERHQLDERA